MNYLELCKVCAREAGIAGDGPPTTANQTGEHGDVVRWVKDAYVDIQNRHGGLWRFLRSQYFFIPLPDNDIDEFGWENLIDVSLTPPVVTRFNRFKLDDEDPLTISEELDNNKLYLTYLDYNSMKNVYGMETVPPSLPAHYTLTPDDKIWIGPPADKLYYVQGEYWKGPMFLANDSDVPEMPVQFHMLIVWYALEQYGDFETAGDVTIRAAKNKLRMMRSLESNQLERIRMGAPLA